MPDTFAHLLCANKTLNRLPEGLSSLLSDHRDAYLIGAQGPDLFYYHRFYGPSHGRSFQTGLTLHKTGIGSFFENAEGLLARARKTAPDAYPVLFAYLAGFLTHYALDRISHPFVCFHSGLYNESDPSSRPYKYSHKRFESILDTLLCKRETLPLGAMRHYTFFSTEKTRDRLIDRFLKETIHRSHGLNLSFFHFDQAVRDMRIGLRLLRDATALKRKALHVLETLTCDGHFYSPLLYPSLETDVLDFANEKGAEWHNPFDPCTTSTVNYYELFENAVEESILFIKSLETCVLNDSPAPLLSLVREISYATGTDWRTPFSKAAFRIVFDCPVSL